VTLTARLPQVMVPTRNLSQLREGSILQMDHTVETPVEVYLNGRLVYHASLGQVQRRLGLRITQAIPAPLSERPVRGKEGRVL
jgi:flagellar motor switch protein FliN/FliY